MEKLSFNKDRSHVFAAYAKEKLTKKTQIHPYLSWALIGAKLFKPSMSRIREIEAIIKHGNNELSDYLKNRVNCLYFTVVLVERCHM